MENWIMGLTGAAVLSMLAVAITPQGRVKKAVKLVCGFVVILSLLSGITDFDYRLYSKSMADHRRDIDKLIDKSIEEQTVMEREYIEAECEAYILDKADELGTNCESVSMTLRWSSEGYWYPSEAELNMEYHPELSSYIEGELGVPEDSQTWRENDG